MDLNIISVNIRFNNPNDGVNAWPHRKFFLADTILKHSPDIIATQEGWQDQLQELHQLLPDYSMIDNHRDWISDRMYPTIFVKKDIFKIEASHDKWLSLTPDVAASKSFESSFPRLMTCASLTHLSGVKFLVVNTHFDHIKESTRFHQARVLCEETKKLKLKDQKLILLGDFNDSPVSDARKVITTAFPELIDSWALFNANEETSHHNFNNYLNAGSRIDWILVDKDFQVVASELDKSHQGDLYPSDHYPVITKINF